MGWGSNLDPTRPIKHVMWGVFFCVAVDAALSWGCADVRHGPCRFRRKRPPTTTEGGFVCGGVGELAWVHPRMTYPAVYAQFVARGAPQMLQREIMGQTWGGNTGGLEPSPQPP